MKSVNAKEMDHQHKMFTRFVHIGTLVVLSIGAIVCVAAAPESSTQANTCRRELEYANRTIARWATTMEEMVNESKLPTSIRDSIHSEANKVLDMIEEFGLNVGRKQEVPAAQLARDLVQIRRRSNRMALDIYLNTFDMRWPQNSLQLGVIVERVQQACLDRQSIQALESPADPLDLGRPLA